MRIEFDASERQPLAEDRQRLVENLKPSDGLRVALAGGFLRAGDCVLDHLQVRQDEFEFDRLDIAERVERLVNVGDVVIREAPNQVDDCIDIA